MWSWVNSIFLVSLIIYHLSYGEIIIINCQKNAAECSCNSTIFAEICTFNCIGAGRQCRNDILICRDNDDCIINCQEARGCQGAQITCPANANCILNCKQGVHAVCDRLNINITNVLSYHCTGDCPIVPTQQPTTSTTSTTISPTISPTTPLLSTLGVQFLNTNKSTNYGDGLVNDQTTQSFDFENENTIISNHINEITMMIILLCGVFGFIVCLIILVGCFYYQPGVKESECTAKNDKRPEIHLHIPSNSSTDTVQTQYTVGSTELFQIPQVILNRDDAVLDHLDGSINITVLHNKFNNTSYVSQMVQAVHNDEEVLSSDENDVTANGHKLSEEEQIVFYKMYSEGGENYHKLEGQNSIDKKCNVSIQMQQIQKDTPVGDQVTPFGGDTRLHQVSAIHVIDEMDEGNDGIYSGDTGTDFLHQVMDDIVIGDDEMVKTTKNGNNITSYDDMLKDINYHE